MKLTIKTDLCLRVLIHLQMHKTRTKIQEIAEDYGVSKNHLAVAVNKLSELGYITSSPGPKGGIEFNPKMSERTVGELVEAIEEIDLVECFNPETNTCSLNPRCRLKVMLKQASLSFIKELKNYKLKDLV